MTGGRIPREPDHSRSFGLSALDVVVGQGILRVVSHYFSIDSWKLKLIAE